MCEFEVKITPWLLGDLPEAETATMARHVRDCPECAAVKAELELFIPELQNALDQDDIQLPAKVNLAPKTPQHHRFSTLRTWTIRHAALFVAALTTLVITLMLAMVRNNSTHRRNNNATPTSIEFHKYRADAPPALRSVELPENTAQPEDTALVAAPPMPNPSIPTTPPVVQEPHFPDLPRLVSPEELAVLQAQPTQPHPPPPAAPTSKMARQRRSPKSDIPSPLPLARTPIAVGARQKLVVTNNISTNNLATNLNSTATNTLSEPLKTN